MYLGKVVGTLVATQKEASLDGLKFLVVRRLTVDYQLAFFMPGISPRLANSRKQQRQIFSLR